MAGSTTIRGDRTGYVDVTLSKPVFIDLSLAKNRTFAFSGGGRFAGVVFELLDRPFPSSVIFAAGRFDPSLFCADSCSAPIPFTTVMAPGGAIPTPENPNMSAIPAGRYRIYLISAAGPAKAVLTLPGLDGTADLPVDHSHQAVFHVLPRRDPLSGPSASMVFGDTLPLSGPGIILSTLAVYSQPYVMSAREICRYDGTPQHPVAYYPTCPALPGDPEGGAYDYPALPSPQTQPSVLPLQTLDAHPAGQYGFGGSVTTAGGVVSGAWATVRMQLAGAARTVAKSTVTNRSSSRLFP